MPASERRAIILGCAQYLQPTQTGCGQYLQPTQTGSMRNIKLTLAYDGAEFHGWQIQPGRPTVQGLIADILHRLTQEQVTIHAAGRTDAGVHAWGQVANFKTESHLTPQELAHGMNALLPPAVRVRAAEEADQDFHARWCAEAKTYRYSFYRGRVVPPFLWRYVLHHPHPLDFAAMSEAARCFEGQHDFTTFAASSGSEEDDLDRNVLRAIYRSEMIAAPAACLGDGSFPFDAEHALGTDGWTYVVRGKSFLRHMVRKIVGALLEVGRGRIQPSDIPWLLELRDRARSGPTVPAHGLCLFSVEYPAAPPTLPRKQVGLQ
jgi:tRNA pseudouridine38-40 synthase